MVFVSSILTRLCLPAVPNPQAPGGHGRAGPVEDAVGEVDPRSIMRPVKR